MNEEIARLFVSVDARLNGLESGLKAGERQAQTSGKAIEGSLKGVATQSGHTSETVKRHARETVAENVLLTGSFRSMARQAVLAGGATAIAYAGISKAKNAIETTQELAHQTLNLHKNFGLAVKTASEWAAVSNARGSDGSKLNMAMKQLATQTFAARSAIAGHVKGLDDLHTKDQAALNSAAKQGQTMQQLSALRDKLTGKEQDAVAKAKAQAAVFQTLGISQADLVKHGNDVNFMLHAVADGMHNLPPGTDKAAIAAKLFGRTWIALAPIIRDGSKAMDEQLRSADKLGATFSDKTLRQQHELYEDQIKLKESSLGLKIAFTQGVTPALGAMSTAATKAAQILHGPGSLESKLQQIGKIVAPAFKSIETELEAEIPHIANAAGRSAPKIAGAFVNGFMGADTWGKLALGAFLISKTVGWGTVFKAAGAKAATSFSTSLAATGTAEDAAAGAAGGAAYGTAFSAAATKVPIFGPNGKVIKEVETGVKDVAPLGAAAGGGWLARFKGKLAGAGPEFRVMGLGLGDLIGIGIAAGIIAELPKIEGALGKVLGLGPAFSEEAKRGFKDLIGAGLLFPSNTAKNDTYSGPARNMPGFGGGAPNPRVVPKSAFGGSYQSMTVNAAKRAGIDPTYFLRQIKDESINFNPDVITGRRKSPAGALGIAQFMPATAKGLGIDPLNPRQALNAAARLMASYIKQYGGWRNALVAYNAGPGRVGGPLPAETQRYIANILGPGGGGGGKGGGGSGLSIPGGSSRMEKMSLDSALAWIKKHFPGATAFIEDAGQANQHLHVQDVNHHVTRAIAEALNKMGYAVGEYGGKPIPGVGGITTLKHKHYGAADHYHGGAIDVNSDGQLIKAFGKGAAKPKTPVFRAPTIKQSDILGFLQAQLDHLDLLVQAGQMSQVIADAEKRSDIQRMLPFLKGDSKLQALVTLKGLPKAPNALKQEMAQEKKGWALAFLGKNPGTDNQDILKAAGVNATVDNPWLKAILDKTDLLASAGQLTPEQANALKTNYLTRAASQMSGDNKLQALAAINSLKTSAPSFRDTLEQTVGNYGLMERAGDMSHADAVAAEIKTITDNLGNPDLTAQDRLELRAELGDLTSALKDNTASQQEQIDALKEQNDNLQKLVNVSQAEERVLGRAIAGTVSQTLGARAGRGALTPTMGERY